MDPIDVAPPTAKEVELELALKRFQDLMVEKANERRSLENQLKVQSDKVLRLEAEVVRLKMTRTDAQLAAEVDGLRKEVGKKDRETVELRRELDKVRSDWKDTEKILLLRTSTAEDKAATFQRTFQTMQASRDAADTKVAEADRARAEAVTQMIAASDRARKAEERLAALEKKPDPKALKK